MELPSNVDGSEGNLESFLIHPSLLDSCLHTVIPIAKGDSNSVFLPFSFSGVRFFTANARSTDSATKKLFVHTKLISMENKVAMTKFRIFSADTLEVLATIEKFTARELSQSLLQNSLST